MTQELSEAEATPVWVVVGTDDDEGALYGVFATPELAQEHADEFDDGTVIVQREPVIGSEAAGVTVPTKYESTVDQIEEILAAIPDDELPKPRVVVNPDGTSTAWFGGQGHVLGTARNGDVRDPLLHRRRGTRDAIEQEAVYRLDLASLAEESR
jgi:hypothetical protein